VSRVFAVVSAKHSPGATTTAAALAIAATDDGPTLLVEADPAGGDLAVRHGLSLDPSLVSLAAAGRHRVDLDSNLDGHCQALAAGPAVLLAPTSPSQTAAALRSLGPQLADALARRAGTVIVDGGRWPAEGSVTPLVEAADTILLVARPTLEGIEHIRARLDAAEATTRGRIAVVLVGDRPYPPDEVTDVLSLAVAGVIAVDRRGVRALEVGATGTALRRSALVRSARTVLGSVNRLAPHAAEVAS
jgi:MinD-like ATPase involved in chromosome partitioning or flagellar assembly